MAWREIVQMHPNGQRVQAALAAAGVATRIVETLEGSPTAVTAAAQLDIEVGQVANSLVFDADGTPLGSFDGGGMNGPWGVTVDSAGSLWAANFGGVTQVDTKYGVTHLCGFTASACPAGRDPGDPLTPSTGFTLPSGGAPVTPHSGELLYGAKGPNVAMSTACAASSRASSEERPLSGLAAAWAALP